MHYQTLLDSIKERFISDAITESDLPYIQKLLNKTTVISLLKNILTYPELIQKICDRSYTHALGFDKIVLVDLSKDVPDCKQKTQVRLHIWEPLNDNALPIVESLHEHSFDFISTILSGHLENQQFKLSKLDSEQEELLNSLKSVIEKLNKDELSFLNEQVEIYEALKLQSIGSKQFDSMNLSEKLNFEKAEALTGMTGDQVYALTSLEGHYVSNRVSGERKAYKHVLKDYVSLTPHNVMKLDKGDYYFHPYQLPHRLYYDNTILNSTILVTTPVKSNPEGGSLQRPTYVQHDEQAYDKISLTFQQFKAKLEKYLKFLENN